MKVALVYDRVNKWGGAERVLLVLHEMFPDAPLYTSVYNPKSAPWARVFPKVIPSFLQKIPFLQSRHDLLAPLMPFAFESFTFSEYDLVISVTSESAKGIITGPHTKHLCYLLTPTRYLWSGYHEYFNSTFKKLFVPVVTVLRKWDVVASSRPDYIITISNNVKDRVKHYYNKDTQVIFPPVDVDKKLKSPKFRMSLKGIPENYYLIVSRLVPYKKVDLAILAFNQLKVPLLVVGRGSEERKLKRLAGPTIKFVGNIPDSELDNLYAHSKALIFPQEEDFGIAAVEAQACGKPVIAYSKGGAQDTVIDGKTGIFFEEQTTASLKNAVLKFQKLKFYPQDCLNNAQKFSKERFAAEFLHLVKNI